MRLVQFLILNRYCHHLLGAQRLEELKAALAYLKEGPGGEGQSHFFHALVGRRGVQVPEEKLQEYDTRLLGYEARLAKARGGGRLHVFPVSQLALHGDLS